MKMNICPHDKYIVTCKVCNGGEICVHGNIRSLCQICYNYQMCEHNRRLLRCTICSRTGEKKHFLGSLNWFQGITKFFKK